MKKILIIPVITLITAISISSCAKENIVKKDEWIQIDSIVPGFETSKKLNSIISKQNVCLQDLSNIKYDTVITQFFTHEDFMNIDTCNEIPEIDFNKYSLTAGGFYVKYFQYKISDIKLFSNELKASYNLEISIDTCDYCYAWTDVKYFWKIYPKLKSDFQFKILIKNVNQL